MKFLTSMILAVPIMAGNAAVAADASYQTIGDMTNEDLAAIISLREKSDNLFDAMYSANKKMGNAVLASVLGVVLDAGALTTGLIKDSRQKKMDAKTLSELDELSEADLRARFTTEFMSDCESDRTSNPDKYKTVTENPDDPEKPIETDVTCDDMLANFAGDAEAAATREAMTEYLSNKKAGGDSAMQTMNWIRMGASAGGAIASGVSAGITGSAIGDLDNAINAANVYNAALRDFYKVAMQARLSGRTNNPLGNIAACNANINLSGPRDSLKTAKTFQIVGVVAGVGSAATSGLQNVNRVGEKNWMNMASNISAGVGVLASGVSIGVVASNKSKVSKEQDKVVKCQEWLWWDENGHGYTDAGEDGEKPGEVTTCPDGKKLENGSCVWDVHPVGWNGYTNKTVFNVGWNDITDFCHSRQSQSDCEIFAFQGSDHTKQYRTFVPNIGMEIGGISQVYSTTDAACSVGCGTDLINQFKSSSNYVPGSMVTQLGRISQIDRCIVVPFKDVENSNKLRCAAIDSDNKTSVMKTVGCEWDTLNNRCLRPQLTCIGEQCIEGRM